jgi:hypothetical protein
MEFRDPLRTTGSALKNWALAQAQDSLVVGALLADHSTFCACSEVGSGERTAEESPPGGRVRDETDYFRFATTSPIDLSSSVKCHSARLYFRKARRDSNAVTNRIELCASSPGEKTMRRYHHIGIPTTESKPGETHLKDLKLFVVSHQKSEFGVEWMRFEADAAVPDLVRRVAHVAFEVTDLSSELAGREILIPPNSPSDGVRVAFIVENGAPIELLEFTDPKHPARLSNQMDE